MSFGVVIRPQHWSWAEMAMQWAEMEALGFESIWTNDHLHGLLGPVDGIAFEAQTTLAAIAMSTSKVRFGAMTYSVTHRNPAILLKQMVTLDHMSNGRAILGIGAGWYEDEHAAFAVPFPDAGDRVSMLAEALDIFRTLETEFHPTHDGKFFHLHDTPFSPQPVRGHIPILIGGTKPRMLKLAGRYADIWDSSLAPDELAIALATVREHAASAGRDPGAIVSSTGVWGPSSAWSGPPSDSDFANKVRAAYRAGARQLLFKHTPDRAGIDTIPHLMETVVPELRAELER
ncbi:MAG TPA: LLM class flavin-dependent oxidoreductase [Thermomicrobiales bacterium]|nr:LLM class flavin-dependent oxidoreductase [Thermomicrobiales bacterium]HRA47278.1 LLM class flavin-dependent oxidoreductase [Thermomicrobiales bacterium]